MRNRVHHATPENTGENALLFVIVAFMKDDTERDIYVYLSGFGGFVLITLSAVPIYICFRKYKSKQLKNNHITEPDNNQTNEESSTENVYEIIDESSIFDENIQTTNPTERLEDDKNPQSGSEISSTNSGYLHPYTTFTERNETHTYCTQINTNNSSSLSSSSSSLRRDSGYTHPLRTLANWTQRISNSTKDRLHTNI
ncbi:unnamed protein product [Mytilus edulis]|uniref:Uncharacterized protein n=1 Tax=Mytilus edulis TaxID=6550 RepID=A0A8S3VBC4_MYTED|nr:unnamed protein product [Mytilus edulis]